MQYIQLKIPAIIRNQKVQIETDVADNGNLLLFSKLFMKKTNMKLIFKDEQISINSENILLITTNSGYYAIPITKAKKLVINLDRENYMNITLKVTENNKGDHYITLKLHEQFVDLSESKLLELINNASQLWHNTENLKEEIKKVSGNCSICKLFKELPSRPAVELAMATEFQEIVAMDLAFNKSKILFHLADHSARSFASTFKPYKNPETIIKFLFNIWISVYGTPEKTYDWQSWRIC